MLTSDGGILHLGCHVVYGILDPVASVTAVCNAHHSMQNLVQSVTHCAVNKRQLTTIMQHRAQFVEDVMVCLHSRS